MWERSTGGVDKPRKPVMTPFLARVTKPPEKARITELEREVRQRKQEREILKNAMSIFADKERA